MGHEHSEDARSAARFSLTLDGVEIGQFSGLARMAPATIVLTDGTSPVGLLATWHQSVVDGRIVAYKDASIVAYDADGTAVARYSLENAWPSRVEIGALEADPRITSYASVTLTCEDIQRVPA